MNAKKRALGKGLSALLENSDIDHSPVYDVDGELLAPGTIGKIPLEKIISNPFQPRADFDEESLLELAASIKEQGVIQPVTVRKGDDGLYQLISGERRCKAARMVGLTEIPAYIVSASENSMLEMAIVENIQRENLNPIEIGLAYKQLIQGYQLTQEMLSERLGKSRSSIANHLRLLTLPGEIQVGLRQDLISMGHARALVSIGDIQTQLDIYNDILAQGLSVREVEEIVKNLSEQRVEEEEKPVGKKPTSSLHKQKYQSLQKQLSEFYGSKVQIKSKPEGKGTIVINFSSEEDLERIIGLIPS